jgi:hypothetical protein
MFSRSSRTAFCWHLLLFSNTVCAALVWAYAVAYSNTERTARGLWPSCWAWCRYKHSRWCMYRQTKHNSHTLYQNHWSFVVYSVCQRPLAWTPIYLAAFHGEVTMCCELLNRDADYILTDLRRHTVSWLFRCVFVCTFNRTIYVCALAPTLTFGWKRWKCTRRESVFHFIVVELYECAHLRVCVRNCFVRSVDACQTTYN